MWAAFLYKLQEDETLTKTASPVLDILVQIHKPNGAKIVEIKSTVNTIKTQVFKKAKSNPVVNLRILMSDPITWAKVLYLLQNVESEELKPHFSKLLTTLIHTWTTQFDSQNGELLFSSDDFGELMVYARFSGDNPNVLLLNSLRDQVDDDLTLARRLDEERKTKYFLSGVLSALFCSWIGMPYNAARESNLLVVAYEYLSSDAVISWCKQNEQSQDVGGKLLDRLLENSVDKVMWAKYLNKLQNDKIMHDIVSKVLEALCRK